MWLLKTCPNCAAELIIHDTLWPKHNLRDEPQWMSNALCPLSHTYVERRKPLPKNPMAQVYKDIKNRSQRSTKPQSTMGKAFPKALQET
jgi:hypothetical protein